MKKIILMLAFFSALEISPAALFAQSYAHHHKTITKKAKYRHQWSKRAKGAAIGGGAGAVVGGLAGRSVGGALLGGALGAGAGYVVGNETDKHRGRKPPVQKVVKRKTITNE